MRHLVIVALATFAMALPALAMDEAESIFNAQVGSGSPEIPPQSVWTPPGDAVVLYDNGGLITHPNSCPAPNPNASWLQTNLGLTIYGFGHQVSAGNRIADDFTIPAGGCWDIQVLTFFAYQTGATTPTINAVNFRIWNGPPNAGGTVIFGDTSTNRLVNSMMSGIRRTIDTNPCDGTRLIMADICVPGASLILNAGTYWLDWQTGGTLTSGPWVPPVSLLNQTNKPGSNALQFTTAWAPALDGTIPQDVPFIIEGVDCGATAVEPATWGAIKSLY